MSMSLNFRFHTDDCFFRSPKKVPNKCHLSVDFHPGGGLHVGHDHGQVTFFDTLQFVYIFMLFVYIADSKRRQS